MSMAISNGRIAHAHDPEPGLVGLAERGWLPDAAIRLGIRRLCAQRLEQCLAGGATAQQARHQQLVQTLGRMPLAVHTEAANAQHYEVPAAFFERCLGPALKYSACLFEHPDTTLAQAEEAMLALYGERAGLVDGMDILELGCGWGSLTLWMARRYPGARITAVQRGTPAALSGLRAGDVVIGYDGFLIDDADELFRSVRGDQVGSRPLLDVLRDGRSVQVQPSEEWPDG